MIDQKSLEYIDCPNCKGDLEYRPGDGEQPEELICPACKLAYPVNGTVPVMLVEQARSLEE